MHWDQILTVFAIIVTNFGVVFSLFFNLDKKIEEKSERNDKLYEMFIDLLKERRKQED